MNLRTLGLRLLGAAIALTVAGQQAAAQTVSDFSGIWTVEKPSKDIRTRDGGMPPLLPDSLKLYEQRQKQAAQGDLSFDPVDAKCAMPGVPRILAMPYPFQIFRNALRVVFVYEFNHNFRSVDIAESVPAADWGTAYGKATAAFAGDQMVIKTGGLTDETFLDALGMPHSSALRITETYRMLNGGKRLAVDLRIEDPEVFSAPWETSLTFRRLPNHQLQEDVCLDRKADGEPVIDWRRQQK
ncbi:MAG: hypothetical protein BGP16_14335 [Sphingobium sp. 66-54]|nr:MAG: hypothetical protein BGP16_14335 [Sphingobium sp. 66-54]